ncbi:hypothetical protein ACI1UN_04490 [Lactococcus petauri]|uniref:hypothetical protein n=1 Tax=Lactococcus petauri TaxID=1940789 RepID=UPI00385425CE
MNELLQPILALGGIGYINYLFYERISDRHFKTDMDKKFFIGAMTSLNYIIYMFISLWNQERFWTIIYAIIISFVFTLLLPKLVNLVFKFTNRVREDTGLTTQATKKLFNEVFGKDDMQIVFLFSIPDNSFITSGYLDMYSGEGDDFSVNVISQYWDEPTKLISKEQELLEYLEEKNIKAEIYVNFDKKIKAIYFSVPEA